jgi:YbbR domain-containing protein
MSEQARTWLLRLLALGIAVGIWFNASVEDRLVSSEKVVEAGVTYNRPRGFLIVNPTTQTVNVRLLGSERAIRQLNPYMVDVQVELSQRQEGSATISLSRDNVQAPDGLEVVSIEPATIRVDLEREVAQRVTVVPQLVGKLAPGFLMDEPEVFPSQVLVTGPESMLARIETLSTRPIDLAGRAGTFEETVPVISPDPLIQIVQPSTVTIRIPVKPPAEEEAGEPDTRKETP